jgi:hypothetical protein
MDNNLTKLLSGEHCRLEHIEQYKTEIIADAKAQAQKTIWRLGEIGGYTELDLPVALDLETNCVRRISGDPIEQEVCLKQRGSSI